jgi:hypothetical protein
MNRGQKHLSGMSKRHKKPRFETHVDIKAISFQAEKWKVTSKSYEDLRGHNEIGKETSVQPEKIFDHSSATTSS